MINGTLHRVLNTGPVNSILRSFNDIHLQELLKESSLSFIIRVFGMASGYLFILLVTRNFGAGAMGILAVCMTLLNITAIFGKLGFDIALLRFVSEYTSTDRRDRVKEVYTKAMRFTLPLSLSLSILVFITSPLIAEKLFHKQYLSKYFMMSSIAVVPIVIVLIQKQALRGLKRIKEFSFLDTMSNQLFAMIILLMLILFVKDTSVPVIAFISGVCISALLSLLLWQKHGGFSKTTPSCEMKMKDVFVVSFPMFLASSMHLLMHWTDTAMLGIFRTEAEVGVYYAALKLATLTSISLAAINSIAAPKFAEFYAKRDVRGLERVVRHSTRLIFWTSFPVLLVFFTMSSPVLSLFGEGFSSGRYALMFLTIGQFINAISGSVGLLLNMTGRQKVFRNILLIATCLNILLNYLLIPVYGINGAAVASMVSMGFWNMSAVVYIQYNMKITTFYIPIIKS